MKLVEFRQAVHQYYHETCCEKVLEQKIDRDELLKLQYNVRLGKRHFVEGSHLRGLSAYCQEGQLLILALINHNIPNGDRYLVCQLWREGVMTESCICIERYGALLMIISMKIFDRACVHKNLLRLAIRLAMTPRDDLDFVFFRDIMCKSEQRSQIPMASYPGRHRHHPLSMRSSPRVNYTDIRPIVVVSNFCVSHMVDIGNNPSKTPYLLFTWEGRNVKEPLRQSKTPDLLVSAFADHNNAFLDAIFTSPLGRHAANKKQPKSMAAWLKMEPNLRKQSEPDVTFVPTNAIPIPRLPDTLANLPGTIQPTVPPTLRPLKQPRTPTNQSLNNRPTTHTQSQQSGDNGFWKAVRSGGPMPTLTKRKKGKKLPQGFVDVVDIFYD